MQSETKFSPRIFPNSQKKKFFRLNFVSDCIYLGLYLSWTEFCLGLHTAVYFVCNPLFYIFEQNQLNLSSSQLNLVFQLWHVTWQRDVIFRKDSQGCAPRIWNSDHLCHICSTSPNDHIAVYTYRNERKQPYTRSKLISEHFNQINLA